MVALFLVFAASLIFNGVSATADPLHWTSVFIAFASLFTVFSVAGLAGRYLRNKPVHLGKTRYYIVVGIILTASIATGSIYASSPHEWPLPWAFQGAYADYSGSGNLSNGTPYAANLTLLALTANGQTVHLQENISVTVGGSSQSQVNDSWVSATAADPQLGGVVGGGVSRTYGANLTLDGKTVPVTAYVYPPIVNNNHSLVPTVFESKSIHFIVELDFSIDGNPGINIHLTRTNIPGLMP